MEKNYPIMLCWPLLVTLAWFASMTWVWTKIGTVGVAWGLPLSAIVSLPVAKTFSWLGHGFEGRRAMLLSAFAWGASVAGLCSIWSQEGLQALLDAQASAEFANWFRPLVITPVTEEVFKGLFLLWILRYRRSQIRGLLDGIVYGGLIGAGFAFSEQVMYFGQMIIGYLATDATDAPGVKLAMSFVLRGLMVPFMHPFLVAIIGLGVAIAAGSHNRVRQTAAVLVGFLVSIALHGVWDWAALSAGDPFLIYKIYAAVMFPLFTAMAITALILRHRQAKAPIAGRVNPIMEMAYSQNKTSPYCSAEPSLIAPQTLAAQNASREESWNEKAL